MKYRCHPVGDFGELSRAAVVEGLEGRTLLSGVPLAVSEPDVFGGMELKIVGTAWLLAA